MAGNVPYGLPFREVGRVELLNYRHCFKTQKGQALRNFRKVRVSQQRLGVSGCAVSGCAVWF